MSSGARLTVRDAPELVETWYASGEVDLVVGCFSTALATAALYGVPAARVGTELLLERLNPYETSNRMAGYRDRRHRAPAAGAWPPARTFDPRTAPSLTTEQLVNTVGYLMQPTRNTDLRDAASELLEQRFEELRPYVRRSRLSQLGLPAGRGPDTPGNSAPNSSPAARAPAEVASSTEQDRSQSRTGARG